MDNLQNTRASRRYRCVYEGGEKYSRMVTDLDRQFTIEDRDVGTQLARPPSYDDVRALIGDAFDEGYKAAIGDMGILRRIWMLVRLRLATALWRWGTRISP